MHSPIKISAGNVKRIIRERDVRTRQAGKIAQICGCMPVVHAQGELNMQALEDRCDLLIHEVRRTRGVALQPAVGIGAGSPPMDELQARLKMHKTCSVSVLELLEAQKGDTKEQGDIRLRGHLGRLSSEKRCGLAVMLQRPDESSIADLSRGDAGQNEAVDGFEAFMQRGNRNDRVFQWSFIMSDLEEERKPFIGVMLS